MQSESGCGQTVLCEVPVDGEEDAVNRQYGNKYITPN